MPSQWNQGVRFMTVGPHYGETGKGATSYNNVTLPDWAVSMSPSWASSHGYQLDPHGYNPQSWGQTAEGRWFYYGDPSNSPVPRTVEFRWPGVTQDYGDISPPGGWGGGEGPFQGRAPSSDAIHEYVDKYGTKSLLAGGMTADAINRALSGDKGKGGGAPIDYYGTTDGNVGRFARGARAIAGKNYALGINPSSSANPYGGRAGTSQGAFSWGGMGGVPSYGSNIAGYNQGGNYTGFTGGQWASMASQAAAAQGMAFASNTAGMGLTSSGEGPNRAGWWDRGLEGPAGASSPRMRSMQAASSGAGRMKVPWYISTPNQPISYGGHSTDAPTGYKLNPAEHNWLASGGVNSGMPAPAGWFAQTYGGAPSQPFKQEAESAFKKPAQTTKIVA